MKIRSILVVLLFCAFGLFAQDRATLTGTVTDPSGASVPDATVKATNTATNTASETKTTADGLYTIPYLIPGVYTVEVTAPGFQGLKRADITLAVGARLNLPLQLIVGQATTEVTVTGQQELINTADANRGLTFDPVKTQEYPLNGRQSYMLLALTPGVIFTQEQFGASGFSGTRGWDVNSSYKFNGARAGNGNNAFLLNGTLISDNGSQWDFAPSVDAIQEFSAMTTIYDAQYGHEAGGVVNTVIKSGSNNWHGTAFDYLRNRVLDANTFGNNLVGAAKGRHNVNQFGGTFGGPIRKDKDFLFASFEGWQEVIPFPGSGVTAVPLDLRNGQHFSNYNITVFDPLTTHLCGAATEPCSGSTGSTYWRSPFPGDVIPQNRISPVATKILSYLPAPNTSGQGGVNGFPGITNNFINPTNEGRYWYNSPIIKWDHNFSDRDKFNMSFSENHGFEYRSTNTFAPPVATGNTYNNRTFTGINLDETHVLSPTAVLDLRAGWFRFVQFSPGYTTEALAITPASLGMTGMVHAPSVTQSAIPNINIGGFTGSLFGSGSYSWSPYNSWDVTPNVTWTKNNHTFHFGFEAHYEAKGNVAPGNAYGALTFGSGLTQQAVSYAATNNGGTDGFMGIASLLLGMPTSGNIDNNTTYYATRSYYAWYAQDTWRATSRLTVDIGLRYEFQLPYLERYNRMNSRFDINQVNPESPLVLAQWNANAAAYNATNPKLPYPTAPAAILGVWQFAGLNGLPRRKNYTDYTNGAPRIGLAYRLDDKTVIRTGFGTYYQSDTNNINGQNGFSIQTPYLANVNSPYLPSACDNGGCGNGVPTGPYSLVNPFPSGLLTPQGTSLGALANIGQGQNGNILTYKIPRTYQYSFGIQRQLPSNMVLDVSYAGNNNRFNTTGSGHDLFHPQDLTGIQNQQMAMNDSSSTTGIFARSLANPFYGIPGIPTNTGVGSSPNISSGTLINQNAMAMWGGYSDGNISARIFRSDALQVRFEKRTFGDANSAAGTLTWVFSYTFSKQMFWDCCIGQSWSNTVGANLVLSPDGKTGTLAPTQITSPKSLFYWQPDSANKPQEFAFSGVWDLPLGKGRRFFSGVGGVGDKIVSGWTIPWTLSYISGSFVGLPNAENFCGDYTHYKDPVTGQFTGQTPQHWFNNNASCYANFPSNSINTALPPRFSGNVENPAKPQLNIAAEKNVRFKERYTVTFRGEAFNISNSAIRPGPGSTSFTSSTFGIIPNVQNNFPRLVQLALRLGF
ncbi:MAG: TonB-dependent receptor [Candidatus Sulfopaludibacter sp.]|nr:TonB-dependent receptor [Candidatus Sulfopaludibacter sp.]